MTQTADDDQPYIYPERKNQKKTIVADTASKPIAVSDLAKNINDYFWYRRKVSEDAKGPIIYEFTISQVILSGKELSQRAVWVLIWRTLCENPAYSYFINNALSNIRIKTLTWLSERFAMGD